VFINSGSRHFSKQTILLQDMIESIYEDMSDKTEDYADTISQV
jgi:hypothetical protein